MAAIDLNIPYEEDPDRASEVVREVDCDLRSDPMFEPQILEPVEPRNRSPLPSGPRDLSELVPVSAALR